jgi:hypothetical protein
MEASSYSIPPTGYLIKITLLSWFSMIGFDFFLHAGLLAPLYSQPSPFLLSPERAFALIPLGYLSFLIFGIFLLWLMVRLEIKGWKKGAIFGLQVGFLTWGSFSLGLYSISTVSPLLLTGWFLGQALELGIAGGVIGHGLEQSKLRRLFISVSIFVAVSVVLSVILQNVGFG